MLFTHLAWESFNNHRKSNQNNIKKQQLTTWKCSTKWEQKRPIIFKWETKESHLQYRKLPMNNNNSHSHNNTNSKTRRRPTKKKGGEKKYVHKSIIDVRITSNNNFTSDLFWFSCIYTHQIYSFWFEVYTHPYTHTQIIIDIFTKVLHRCDMNALSERINRGGENGQNKTDHKNEREKNGHRSGTNIKIV